jgi:sigma-B regulation protein RsbU (phosphoserine phosphatase)
MAKMRYAARAFACEDPDPGSVVTRLDNFFRHLRRGDEIVTALIGLLDTERHTLEVASAGHVPPLVLHPGASRFVDLVVRPPLGVTIDGSARTTAVDLPVGTIVLLYTDGLVERRGEDLDEGLDRLARSARAARSDDVVSTRDAVIASCIGSREDDLCLLVLARTGE